MEVRRFVEGADYGDAANWWSEHKWTIVPPQFLPLLGLVVEDSEIKYCMGWLYRTDSKICWLEWIVSNPKAPMKKRSEAIDLLIVELVKVAREMEYKCIFSSLRHKGLMRRFEKVGFTKGDEGMTNMMWRS